MNKIILLLISLSIFLCANEKVILQLKWLHQFQFAGYYAAKEKGFYSDVGLDVEIRQRDLRYNNIQQVIDNEAQYGIADSILFLYKSKKEPVVIVSPIFQHSPSVLLSLKSSKIDSVYKMNNKNMVFYDNDTDGFTILAMLKKLGIKPNIIRKRSKNDYLKLIDKTTDIFPAYLSNEPFYFKQKDIGINIFDPKNYGFDLYGDVLFTNELEAKNNPQRVKRFKEATLKGWKYALENKKEIIELIYKKYNSKKSIEDLAFEAKVIERMISMDTIPLSTVDKGRIKFIYSLYKDYGLTNTELDIKDFIFEDYLENTFLIDLTNEEKEYLKSKKVIRVQNTSILAPYTFYVNNQAQGYTIDYLKLMGEFMNVDIEFTSEKTWTKNINMLKNGDIDIIPKVAKSKGDEFIGFTDFKHIDYIPSIIIRKDSKIERFEDLKDKKIAVLNQSFVHKILEKKLSNMDLVLFSDASEVLSAVASGNVDAAIDNLATMQFYIQQNWLTNLKIIKIKNSNILKPTALFMGVSKQNVLLKSILEKVNNALPYDEVLKLKQKWISDKVSKQRIFSNKELSYLEKKKGLNFCIDPNWMPYEKIENGEHTGISSNYINLFSEKLPIPLNLVPTNDWNETLKKAIERKCDFITIMFETKERKKHFNFSNKYLESSFVIATKINEPFINDISNVLDKTFGIVQGYAYKDILKDKYPNIKLLDVSNSQDGLEKVNNGEIFGFIDSLPVIGYEIQNKYSGNLKITGKISDLGFSIASRNDEPLLNEIFNKLIKNIPLDKKQSILNKWIHVKYQEKVDYSRLLWASFIFIIILAVIVYKNKSINEINNQMQKYIDVIDKNVLTSSTDTNGIITSASQAFCNISGYSKRELLGKNHNIIRHIDMDEAIFEDLWRTISTGKTWKGEIKNRKKDGSFYWVFATVSPMFDNKNSIIGYTSIRADITDKKKVEELSITDELTGLYNKRYFNEVLLKEINIIKRDENRIGYIMFDVDHFKQYNDNYGHQKGDEVLSSIGKVLSSCCKRSTDTPFRIGGEEFAIIFHPHFEESAMQFAQIIKDAIENLKIDHKYNSASKYITVSMGVYTAPWNKVESSSNIYKLADDALYEAKKQGRNSICKI